jgi:tellurite resistance protein TerC
VAISIWIWAGFVAFVLAMLALDLGVFQRRAHAVSMREAGIWSAVWISLALVFNGIIYLWRGPVPAMEFFGGYLMEKALSVDNLFVFALVFTLFGVPALYQHRVLFWGVLGAIVLRGAFIAAGAALLHQFHWVIYVFGVFLIVTGVKLAFQKEKELHPEDNGLVKLARRLIPVTPGYEGERFFVRRAGRLMATPLFLVLLVVETSDVVFAVDSIPAVFGITQDTFLVYTSNVFAILGLRSLFFLLSGALDRFHYLKVALAAILSFVGVKMLVAEWYKVPIGLSLGVIAGMLAVAMAASLLRASRLDAEARLEPCVPAEG